MAYTPYIFFFAAMILAAPHYFFSLIMKPLATKFEATYSGCDMISHSKDEKVLGKVKDRICRILINLTNDRKYITLFLVARLIYILSLVLVGLFLSSAFGRNFFVLGFRAAFFFVGDNHKKVYERFPTLGYCQISVRELAQATPKNTYVASCNLATNLLLGKIVGFIYVLLYFICAPLALIDTVYTLTYFCSHHKGFNSKTLVMFLLKDSIPPSVYETVKEALNNKMLQMFYNNEIVDKTEKN